MTSREQITVDELLRKIDSLTQTQKTVNEKLDTFMATFEIWKDDFVEPLVKEKADRIIMEQELKKWGKWASVILGLIVSASILIKNFGGK